MKKTKIITTIGPVSKEEEVLKELMVSGTDIIRLNMKHASHDFCKDIIIKIRKLNKKLNINVGILLDLQGPDMMVGKFSSGSAYLNRGDKIRIYEKEVIGDSTKFSVTYTNFVKEVKVNTTLKLNDGLIELKVIDKELDYLLCEVIHGGFIENNSGINVIGMKLDLPFISKKDREDVKFAHEMDVDFLALSFVSGSEDVLEMNDLLIELGNDHISIISKIENESSLEDIDEIIKNSDGILVARGDLGVEIPLERVPGIQKSIIHKCHIAGKISIVATEMMMSMEKSIRPSRAEVSDVATSVLEGVDAVLLAEETTIGNHPVLTVDTMSKIVESSEQDVNYYEFLDKSMRTEKQDITGSLAYSVVECANRLKCRFIVVPTMTGYSAKKLSRFHPICPIIAMTPDEHTARQLSFYYGIYPVVIGKIKTFDEMMEEVKNRISVYKTDETSRIIVTGGYPFSEVKHTNFMKIEEI